MFTGIITGIGRIASSQATEGGVRLRIEAREFGLDDVAIGDSIAVNGVCLTVIEITQSAFDVDVSRETLGCVTAFDEGMPVNLEKALRLADRLGGHLVSGHVDGTGIVERFEAIGDNRLLEISLPPGLSKYIASKGSVAVNGVSLTVNAISNDCFAVNLIPHTLASTTLSRLTPGARVNIEVDMMARYAERLRVSPH